MYTLKRVVVSEKHWPDCLFHKYQFELIKRFFISLHSLKLTATDIAPARKPSQKETNLPTIHFQVLLLMAEIRLTTWDVSNPIPKKWINYQPQLVSRISAINSMLVSGFIILPTQTSCTIFWGEIPQIYHTFAVFDPLQIGNLTIPVVPPK